MITKYLMLLCAGLTALSCLAQGTTKLQLTDANIHDATLGNEGGVYQIKTTGSDPYLFTAQVQQPFDAHRHMLSFDYFSTTGTDKFQVFVMSPLSEANSISVA